MLDVPFQYIVYSYYHQQTVAYLLRKLGNYLDAKNMWEWEALPLIKIDESATSPVPDISICCNMEIEAFIEITETAAFKHEFNKAIDLAEKHDIAEVFVFDKKKSTWRKYKQGVGEITENPSFCDSIGYDLNDFLK